MVAERNSFADRLRALADEVGDELIDAWEAGYQNALHDVLQSICDRSNTNPKLKSDGISIDSICSIVQSHERPLRDKYQP